MPNARRNPPAGATPPALPSAPPSPTSERTPNWFICPQCQSTKFGTANPQCFATGEPQILECHGLASDGPPFGCGWKGTWDDVLKAWAKREVAKDDAKLDELERELAHEMASSGEVISRLKAERDSLTRELATTKQALAAKTSELERLRAAINECDSEAESLMDWLNGMADPFSDGVKEWIRDNPERVVFLACRWLARLQSAALAAPVAAEPPVAIDESGNGNHGTLHNVTIRGQQRSWKFDGNTAYIELPFAMTAEEVKKLYTFVTKAEPPADEQAGDALVRGPLVQQIADQRRRIDTLVSQVETAEAALDRLATAKGDNLTVAGESIAMADSLVAWALWKIAELTAKLNAADRELASLPLHPPIYCENCGSCGCGGCCLFFCSACKDRHDGMSRDENDPVEVFTKSDRDRLAAELALYTEACGQLSDLVDLYLHYVGLSNKAVLRGDAENDTLTAENARLTAELAEAKERVAVLEKELEELAEFVQQKHPIGKVKGIGLREGVLGVKQVVEDLETQLAAAQQRLAALAVDPANVDELADRVRTIYWDRPAGSWDKLTEHCKHKWRRIVREVSAVVRSSGEQFECRARIAGSAGGNDPQDCDWPFCGCDPKADKVLEAIEESGRFAEVAELKRQLAELAEPKDAEALAEEYWNARNLAIQWDMLSEHTKAKSTEAMKPILSSVRAPIAQQIDDQARRIDTLVSQVETAEAAFDKLAAAKGDKLTVAGESIAMAGDLVEWSIGRIDLAENDRRGYVNNCEEFNRLTDEKIKAIDDCEKQIAELTKRLNESRSEVGSLRHELGFVQGENAETRRRKHRTRIRELERQIAELTAKLEAAERREKQMHNFYGVRVPRLLDVANRYGCVLEVSNILANGTVSTMESSEFAKLKAERDRLAAELAREKATCKEFMDKWQVEYQRTNEQTRKLLAAEQALADKTSELERLRAAITTHPHGKSTLMDWLKSVSGSTVLGISIRDWAKDLFVRLSAALAAPAAAEPPAAEQAGDAAEKVECNKSEQPKQRRDQELEAVRDLARRLNRWPNAIDYADAGIPSGGQCSCAAMGDCPLRNDEVTCDRSCYANQLRDRIALEREGFDPGARKAVRAAEKVEASELVVKQSLTTAAQPERRFVCPECGEQSGISMIAIQHTPDCDWGQAKAPEVAAAQAKEVKIQNVYAPPELLRAGERLMAKKAAQAKGAAGEGEQEQSLECQIRKAYRGLNDPLFESSMDELRAVEQQLDAQRQRVDAAVASATIERDEEHIACSIRLYRDIVGTTDIPSELHRCEQIKSAYDAQRQRADAAEADRANLLAELERLRKFERAVRDFDESEEDDSPMPRAIGKALEELDQAAKQSTEADFTKLAVLKQSEELPELPPGASWALLYQRNGQMLIWRVYPTEVEARQSPAFKDEYGTRLVRIIPDRSWHVIRDGDSI